MAMPPPLATLGSVAELLAIVQFVTLALEVPAQKNATAFRARLSLIVLRSIVTEPKRAD